MVLLSVPIPRISNKLVKERVLPVPKARVKQVAFCISALSLKALVSYNPNAQTIGLRKGTAENKMTRLLAKTGIPATMATIAIELALLTKHSF